MAIDDNFNEQQNKLIETLDDLEGSQLDEALEGLRAADIAEVLEHLDEVKEGREKVLHLLKKLSLERRAHIIGYLNDDLQASLAEEMPDETLLIILEEMSADERADLFNLLDENRREKLLRQMARQEREDLKRLASYEEGTAGALMTSDYVAINSGMTVSQALMRVRQTAPDAETVYQLYIVDSEGRTAGTMSLRQLMVAPPAAKVDDIMIKDVIQVSVDQEQEEVANLIARYDMLAVPVIDGDERLVGIITHDDAMDVAAEEATEDMHKGASVGKIEGGLRGASLFELYRKRVLWLVLLVFANIFSGAGIAYFEETIEAYIALVFFLPLLVDSGGNAGSQAATLMVRGMATGDVRTRDWAKLLGREVGVALGLGLTMALAVSVVGIFRAGPEIAMVVALSMVLIVMVGSLIGMILPFVLQRFNLDPATASAPLVTSIADASGVLIYFALATAILGLPGS
ncbi:magnesium transporter [Vreelandella zhaodongensis]|uniref:magnesium transporter n=1 Tax=Vreelandella zhaodongensis TaxID=1176240 RepID=UPI003EBE7B12